MTAPIVLRPGEGDGHDIGVARFAVKADSDATDGAYSFVEASGHIFATAHVHHDREEAFYVVEGEVTFLAGDDRVTVGPGSYLLVPRETMHGFQAHGEARLLIIHSPGGFERFFRESAAAVTEGRWSVEWRDELARELGMTYHDDIQVAAD